MAPTNLKFIFVHSIPEIAKINTREIQLPNFRAIKYVRKLVRIRCWKKAERQTCICINGNGKIMCPFC